MRNGLGRKLLASLVLGVIVALLAAMVAVLLLGRPPSTFRLAAGQPGGMYAAFADPLRETLAAEGISVEIDRERRLRGERRPAAHGGGRRGAHPERHRVPHRHRRLDRTVGGVLRALSIFAREGTIELVDGIPVLAGKRLAIGPAGSGTNATARALIEQTGSTAIALEWTTDEAIEGLAAGTIDAAFIVVSANAPLIAELAAIPDLELLPVPNVEGLARRLPFLSPVTLFRGTFDPGASPVPPQDMAMLAARATLMGREGLNPDLARLIVRDLRKVLPVPYVGDLDAFPSLAHTRFPLNEDARKYLEEGPTPLESFLPFETSASPLSRIYLILLPLLVLAFPVDTLAKAAWEWFNNSRVVSWYPRINAIERNLEQSSLDELLEQQAFLERLDEQLARQRRVPAGKMGTLYQLRTHLSFVIARVETRIAELAGDGTQATTKTDDPHRNLGHT